MAGSSINAILGGRGVRRTQRQTSSPASSSVNATVGSGGQGSVRSRVPQRYALPGSRNLAGAILNYNYRNMIVPRARDRIEAINDVLPDYLTDDNPRIQLGVPMEDAAGTYSGDNTRRGLIRLDPATTEGLAGLAVLPVRNKKGQGWHYDALRQPLGERTVRD